MNRFRQYLPTVVTAAFVGAALLLGPVAQLPDYHDFADQRAVFGIPHFADVLSNLGFLLVALWGWAKLSPARGHPGLAHGWAGYRLFLLGLFLTGFGSAWYHLDPDNVRLIWDRLPIALACGGLLAGVWGDARQRDSGRFALGLAAAAIASVAWWFFTGQAGEGDLRPYLLLQALPMVLIPLWQWIYGAPPAERRALGGALLLYAVAKAVELNDHQIAAVLGVLTGHNLKHLLATLAAAVVVGSLLRRVSGARLDSSRMLPEISAAGPFV